MSERCQILQTSQFRGIAQGEKCSNVVTFRKASQTHCKPRQVEPAFIECGNGAAATKVVSQGNLFELGPIKFGPVQISSLELL